MGNITISISDAKLVIKPRGYDTLDLVIGMGEEDFLKENYLHSDEEFSKLNKERDDLDEKVDDLSDELKELKEMYNDALSEIEKLKSTLENARN